MANKTQTSSTQADLAAMMAAIDEGLEMTRARLMKQVETRFARGTREVTKQAKAAVELDLKTRVLQVLVEPKRPKEIAAVLEATQMMTDAALGHLAKDGKVSNVGSVQHPVWFARIGDETSHQDLVRATMALISRSPMTTQEIADATGARYSRASGAIVAIQRGPEKERMINRGFGRAGEWYLMPVNYRPAALEPKRVNKHVVARAPRPSETTDGSD